MLWTAFILGFAGSLHCVGMCSPLVMAVTNGSHGASLNRLLYNLGRILTYGLLGSLIASAGMMLPMTKYQNLLSIFLGIGLVMVGATGVSAIKIPVITTALAKFSIVLKQLFAGVLKHKSHSSIFLLGALNGFLPCGLSFLAFTYCITLSGPLDGFTFMVLFGSGTLPVMLGFTSIFQWALSRFHFNLHRLTATMLIFSGALLIGRVFFVHLPEKGSYTERVIDIVICR